jgi:hypothetical protein
VNAGDFAGDREFYSPPGQPKLCRGEQLFIFVGRSGQRMSQRVGQTARMNKSQSRINYIGKVATVRSSFGDEQLPAGLPEGAMVKITGFDIGFFEVEFQGRRFRISMVCVENLHELWNRWHDCRDEKAGAASGQ